MRHRCASVKPVVFLFSLTCVSAPPADELPRAGRFTVEIEQSGSWEGFAVPHTYWVWIARRKGTYAGSGPLDGMTSRCVSKGTTAFGISTSEVHCENADDDGDKIFEVSTEECACAPGGRGGKGQGELIGGTGKYAGIRGSFEIERKVGARDQAARTWTDFVRIVGRWRLP